MDGCVRRFLRGGSATDLRFFVRLHDLLTAPHSPERAPSSSRERTRPHSPEGTSSRGPERTRDYLRLLPAAPGPVAELALRQLRDPGASGAALSGEEVSEAVAALLFRPEGKLVRAGLTLLGQAARAAGDDLDRLAPALASAFLCESYEVQERSVRLAVKYAGRFTPAGAEAVREAAGVLPPDLAALLAPAYRAADTQAADTEAARAGDLVTDDFEAVELPAFEAPRHRPFPGAIENLAGTFDRLHHEYSFERWLDGFVRAPETRRPPLRPTDLYAGSEWPHLSQWTEALLREAAHPGQEPSVPGREEPARKRPGPLMPGVSDDLAASLAGLGLTLRKSTRLDRPAEGERVFLAAVTKRQPSRREAGPHERLPGRSRVSPPHWAVLLRCAEVHNALKEGALPPYLLATPTSTSGHIDPAVLADRIEGYARAGARPLPADLAQALLRLPREVDPEVSAREIGRAACMERVVVSTS
ncbi:DUF6493 family protein, partial [Nonomuraea sp. NPDC050691]|uniref:DUF7824 domain-containing protein n=1 Tax=Nonomuraea sp. NPDC050691 TaxID=3155661 RepID=UPI0033CBC85E